MLFNPLHIVAFMPLVAAKPIFKHNVARQDVATTATVDPSASNIIMPGYPITPTATPTDEDSTTVDLTASVVNQPLSLLNDAAAVVGIDVPVTCVDCSSFGSVVLSAGDFNFFGNPFDDQPSGFDAGSFRLDTPGFGGKLALQVAAPSKLEQSFTVPFDIPIVGFSLPAVGTIGVFIEFEVILSLESAMPATFDFGFEFTVPNGAFLNIDLGEIANSSSFGFQPSEGLVVKDIPLTANLPDLDFTASATLRTKLLFGLSEFSVLGADVTANAGAFLDLPKVIVSAQQVANVDAQCNVIPANDTCNNAQLISSATLVSPAIAVDLGVQAEVGIDFASRGFDAPVETPLIGTTIALPTACITNGPQNVIAQAITPATPTPVGDIIMSGITN